MGSVDEGGGGGAKSKFWDIFVWMLKQNHSLL